MIRKKIHDFQKFKTIRSFGREIYNGELEMTLQDVLEKQIKFKNERDKFKESVKKGKKLLTFENAHRLFR